MALLSCFTLTWNPAKKGIWSCRSKQLTSAGVRCKRLWKYVMDRMNVKKWETHQSTHWENIRLVEIWTVEAYSKFTMHYPLVNKHSYWTLPFIVDLPIKNGIFHSFLYVYQRVVNNSSQVESSRRDSTGSPCRLFPDHFIRTNHQCLPINCDNCFGVSSSTGFSLIQAWHCLIWAIVFSKNIP